MSRDKRKMSKDIFERIVSSAISDDPSYPVDENDRWIARKDDFDTRLMANAKVSLKRLGQRELASVIEHNGDRYFCVTGFQKPERLSPELESIDPTPGLFAIMVSEGNIPSNATASKARDCLRDCLQDMHLKIDGYIGHELISVAGLFPDILFYQIVCGKEVTYTNDIDRITGSFVVRAYTEYPLGLSENIKSKLIRIFESGSDSIPYSLILQGVLSYSWSSLFLDLYRSIEQLYSAPRLKGLPEKFRQLGTLSELSEVFENLLSWRPREEEALALLLSEISQPTRECLISAFCADLNPKPGATPEKCASHIYRTRNSHVHFRPAMRHKDRSAQEWGEVVSSMCDAVLEVYDHFGADFLSPPKLAK